jgi:formylglycine-generating enzyme required for sulfatase activity/fibronectin type 3 domain-containing protein
VSAATSYKIYYTNATTPDKTLAGTVNSGTTTTYTHTGLPAGSTYTYYVTAENGAGESDYSIYAQATLVPAVPTDVTATTQSVNRIDVSWTAVYGATGYRVFYAPTELGTKTQTGGTLTGTSYSHTSGVTVNNTYYYFIKAFNSAGESDYSAYRVASTNTPDAPTNVTTATLSTSSIRVSWDAVSGATSYKVYRADTETGVKTRIGTGETITETNYVNVNLTENTTYWYFIKAVNALGESVYSAGASGSTHNVPSPSKPLDVTATAQSATSILVSWTASIAASSYEVYYGVSATGAMILAPNGRVSTPVYIHTALLPNTTYWYYVKAINSGGQSENSDIAFATTGPAKPIDLVVTALPTIEASLNWTAVPGATKYKIYRSNTASGLYYDLGSNAAPPYIDGEVVASTRYWYMVSAVNSSGLESERSDTASCTMADPPPAPAAPIGVSATAISYTEVRVEWAAVIGANIYEVYYGTDATGNSQVAGTTTSLSFLVKKLEPGTTYYFTVKASNHGSWSRASVPVSATLDPMIAPVWEPDTPETETTIDLAWSSLNGILSYRIYRIDESVSPSFSELVTVRGTSYTDSELNLRQQYVYKVCAVSPAGVEGPLSDFLIKKTKARPLPAPVLMVVTNLGPPEPNVSARLLVLRWTTVDLSWTDNPEGWRYRIYWSSWNIQQPNGTEQNGHIDVPISDITYTYEGEIGYAYKFKVCVVSGSAPDEEEGPPSNEMSITLADKEVDLYDIILRGTDTSAVMVREVNTLTEACLWLKDNAQIDGSPGHNYDIRLRKNLTVEPTIIFNSSTLNDARATIILSSVQDLYSEERTIYTMTLKAPGALFRVGSGATLQLKNIVLCGIENNETALVSVEPDGTLKTESYSKIHNNHNINHKSLDNLGAQGGGVYVYGGTFTMNGGEISDNMVRNELGAYGGGVYVVDGTFTMNGGGISNNTVKSKLVAYGGGVYVIGTFTMNTGLISNNLVDADVGLETTFYAPHYVTSVTTRYKGFLQNSGIAGGGGVHIAAGKFAMLDGVIRDNSAVSRVDANGFTSIIPSKELYDQISAAGRWDNSYNVVLSQSTILAPKFVYARGGGVNVDGKSTIFTMLGGEISGNQANHLKNTGGVDSLSAGGGVALSGGQFGIRGGATITAHNYPAGIRPASNKASSGKGNAFYGWWEGGPEGNKIYEGYVHKANTTLTDGMGGILLQDSIKGTITHRSVIPVPYDMYKVEYRVTMTWTAVPSATGYRVYHRRDNGGRYTVVYDDQGIACTYTLWKDDLINNHLHSFYVVAYNDRVETDLQFIGSMSYKGIEMVPVEGGTFVMGASEDDSQAEYSEHPAHNVTVSSFQIGKYEITQRQWKDVMGQWPLEAPIPTHDVGLGDDCPIYNVSCENVDQFLRVLNYRTGKKFRLPTEAEWEYAARGGNRSQGYKYSGSNTIDDVAWYPESVAKVDASGALLSPAHPVGTKLPNELGIYDMSGNVFEWCSDWYGGGIFGYDSSEDQTNPTGPLIAITENSRRITRGGSFAHHATYCRVSARTHTRFLEHTPAVGFRVVLDE